MRQACLGSLSEAAAGILQGSPGFRKRISLGLGSGASLHLYRVDSYAACCHKVTMMLHTERAPGFNHTLEQPKQFLLLRKCSCCSQVPKR